MPRDWDESDWRVIESHTEYETGWYTGGYDLLEQPDGTRKRYYWAELAPAVVVVAHDQDRDAVVFVEQYRPAIHTTFLELVAGIIEPDETPAQAAARELREETGFTADHTTLVQEYWVATGVLRHRRAIVYATDLTPGEPATDTNEFLRVTTRPAADALAAAREAPANDATITALFLATHDNHL